MVAREMPSTNDTVLPIAVLTRVPTPGRVKTRLESVVSPEDAARLQEAFLKDVLAASALVPGAKVELHVAGDLAHPAIAALRETYPCYAQVEGDLGARITAAADRLVAEYGRAIVLGSDAPTLPASYECVLDSTVSRTSSSSSAPESVSPVWARQWK